MNYTGVTVLQATAPASGVVSVQLAQKILNAKAIYVSELKVATTSVPFAVQLKFDTKNRENFTVLDQVLDDTYVSLGTQINQVWHDKHEFPGFPAVQFAHTNASIGRLEFKVTDENGTALPWTQLSLKLVIGYEGVPQAKDTLNWQRDQSLQTKNTASTRSTLW